MRKISFIILTSTLFISIIISAILFYGISNKTLLSVMFVSSVLFAVSMFLYISDYLVRRKVAKKIKANIVSEMKAQIAEFMMADLIKMTEERLEEYINIIEKEKDNIALKNKIKQDIKDYEEILGEIVAPDFEGK